jgi:hypothetical protein
MEKLREAVFEGLLQIGGADVDPHFRPVSDL